MLDAPSCLSNSGGAKQPRLITPQLSTLTTVGEVDLRRLLSKLGDHSAAGLRAVAVHDVADRGVASSTLSLAILALALQD